jgi:class 3 adenylate cyclase
MSRLAASKRAQLPGSAFAYVDSRGRRRLPIHDEAHVRNALARFSRVAFENDADRERTRTRLLNAAKKYGIVPVGFITGQLQSERSNATAGRLVIELGRHGAPGELEQRLRSVLRDPTLAVLHWSEASGAYLDGAGRPAPLPAEGDRRVAETVLAAVRFVVEKELLHGQIQATSTDAAALPSGFVTLLMTDIERSTGLLRRLGDRYGDLLNDVRGILRTAVLRAGGREIDARADEYFAVFEQATAAVAAAVAVQRAVGKRRWPDDLDVRVRAGIHSGRPTLTEVGYIGLAVHTTARVCSAAHGGQIVVSSRTRAAVRTATPTGVSFRGLGRHRLPGLPEAETLFQVRAKGLRGAFPKPRISARSRSPRRR